MAGQVNFCLRFLEARLKPLQIPIGLLRWALGLSLGLWGLALGPIVPLVKHNHGPPNAGLVLCEAPAWRMPRLVLVLLRLIQ